MMRSDKKRRGFCDGRSPTIAGAYRVSPPKVFSAVRLGRIVPIPKSAPVLAKLHRVKAVRPMPIKQTARRAETRNTQAVCRRSILGCPDGQSAVFSDA